MTVHFYNDRDGTEIGRQKSYFYAQGLDVLTVNVPKLELLQTTSAAVVRAKHKDLASQPRKTAGTSLCNSYGHQHTDNAEYIIIADCR